MADYMWFAENAAKHGNLVYFMDQSTTAPMEQDGPWGSVNKGYCAGLTVRWLGLTYAGRNFRPTSELLFSDVGARVPYFDGTEWLATVYQGKLRQYTAAVDTSRRDRVQYALGLGQMLLGNELLEEASAPVTGARLFRVLKQSYGGYYVSIGGMVDGKMSNHAFALRHAKPPGGKGPGVLHLFDPNRGHFAWQIASAQWTTILDSFLYFSGYGKTLNKAYLIARATPPIG